MKLNKKILVPAFTLLAGASLAGSVTGTIAWYQYSTRANVSYIGTSAGTIGNLQLRIGDTGDWGTQLSIQDVENYLFAQGIGQEVEPVTPGALDKDGALRDYVWNVSSSDVARGTNVPDGDLGHAYYLKDNGGGNYSFYKYVNDEWVVDNEANIKATAPTSNIHAGDKYVNSTNGKIYEAAYEEKDFYVNPQVGRGPYSEWLKAEAADYVKLPLQFRYIGKDEDDLLAKKIYLSDLVIKKDATSRDPQAANHGDLSDAIRVHFSSFADGDVENAVNHLVSNKGGSTLTHGKLKLGRGADFDEGYNKDMYGFDEGSVWGYVNYGGVGGQQTCYAKSAEGSEGVYYEEEFPVAGWKQVAMTVAAVAPNNENGAEGDFYFNTETSKLYQKGVSVWAEFEEFFSGAADPDLETENPSDKDYYLKTDGNKLFVRGFHEEAISPILVENEDGNPLKIKEASISADKEIGTTVAAKDPGDLDPQKYLNVEVTIWVEGWQQYKRDGKFTSLWDENLIGAMFDVGMQFAVQAE